MLPALPEQPLPVRQSLRRAGRSQPPRPLEAPADMTNQISKMPRRRVAVTAAASLMIASLMVDTTTAAQSGGSLSGTLDSGGAEMWSDADPALAGRDNLSALGPIPEGEAGLDGQPCNGCNDGEEGFGGCGHSPYNRCGCNSQYFPWFTGPGVCDDWCVGPHWNVEADGLILRRETADFGAIAGAVGVAPDLIDQFDYGPGGRLFVTGYNDGSYGLQVGYEGVNDFHATALFPAGGGATRTFDYQSTLNSLEINFIRRTEVPLKVFAGVRYVEVDEDFIDSTIVAQTVPPPSDPPTVASFVDVSDAFLIENRLIGFQSGLLRDAWQLNRWVTIEPFGKAGVYYNNFKRENVNRTRTVVRNSDDLGTPGNEYFETVTNTEFGVVRNFSDIALIGEAGVSAVVRLNRCVALRGGYQVMAIDGVGEGLDAFFVPGLEGTTLVYHGMSFGLEYQR